MTTFDERERAFEAKFARDQMRTQIAAAQTQVAGLISRRRAGAAATPAAAQ